MFKTIAIAVLIILLVYAFLPLNVIDYIGKFALGWMIVDMVAVFTEK
jgi:hypothetical protein